MSGCSYVIFLFDANCSVSDPTRPIRRSLTAANDSLHTPRFIIIFVIVTSANPLSVLEPTTPLHPSAPSSSCTVSLYVPTSTRSYHPPATPMIFVELTIAFVEHSRHHVDHPAFLFEYIASHLSPVSGHGYFVCHPADSIIRRAKHR